MAWPIRNQILLPVALVLLAGIMLTSVSAAVLAARRSERTALAQLEQVVRTLGEAHFPYSENVLRTMRGLSGAEFAVFDDRNEVVASTLDASVLPDVDFIRLPVGDDLAALAKSPPIELQGVRYFVATVRRHDSFRRPTMLLILYPEKSWKQLRWDATLPPLAIGTASLCAMVLLSAWVTNRLGRRIRSVQEQVARIAAGDFREMAVDAPRDDEIHDLTASVNRMTAQLREMRDTIAATERSRTLGQLAGGLAHQLRNAVTGARLAVQIHLRRHPGGADDESLDVALRQLALMEEQLKGLLSLGRIERRPPRPRPLAEVLADVVSLVGPACDHGAVRLSSSIVGDGLDESSPATVADSEGVRSAVLNLTLNAIEAAGSNGAVELRATIEAAGIAIEVFDDGPGPPPELQDRLFETFVTGKPEGVGFGLALARQVAEENYGRLTWDRTPEPRTRFRLELPSRPA